MRASVVRTFPVSHDHERNVEGKSEEESPVLDVGLVQALQLVVVDVPGQVPAEPSFLAHGAAPATPPGVEDLLPSAVLLYPVVVAQLLRHLVQHPGVEREVDGRRPDPVFLPQPTGDLSVPSHVEGQPAQHEDLLAGGIGEVREEALSHVSLHDAHGHGGEKKGGEDVHEEDVALRVYVGHGAGLVRAQVVDPPVVDVDGQDDDEHEEGDGGHVRHDIALHAEEGEPVRAVLPHHVGAVQPQPAGAERRNFVPLPSRESSLGFVRLERVDQSEPPLPLLPRVELCALLAQEALQVVPDEEEGDQHDEDQ